MSNARGPVWAKLLGCKHSSEMFETAESTCFLISWRIIFFIPVRYFVPEAMYGIRRGEWGPSVSNYRNEHFTFWFWKWSKITRDHICIDSTSYYQAFGNTANDRPKSVLKRNQAIALNRGHWSVSRFRENWEIIFRSVSPYFIGHILFGKFYSKNRVNRRERSGFEIIIARLYQLYERAVRRERMKFHTWLKKDFAVSKTPSTLRSHMHTFAKISAHIFACFYSEKFQRRHETFEQGA